MLRRICAGGVVFKDDQVFLLKNEKGEWVLPKGVIRNGDLSREVALRRVKEEAGIDAEIISAVGETSYEFFSVTRHKPVCNEITWYLMAALNPSYKINKSEGFLDGGFFPIDDAINRITYSQDKALVSLSYKKYKEIAV
ncbi:MAG: NUDIX hydrolase [Mahellales bacterium]|jgi:8-oxo-dGTP pyrophosphatase MutT (NUDIX family)